MEGLQGKKLETPKSDDECFQNANSYLIGSVSIAVEKITSFLTIEGFQTIAFSNEVVGEAEKFGKSLYDLISSKFEKTTEKNPLLLCVSVLYIYAG